MEKKPKHFSYSVLKKLDEWHRQGGGSVLQGTPNNHNVNANDEVRTPTLPRKARLLIELCSFFALVWNNNEDVNTTK